MRADLLEAQVARFDRDDAGAVSARVRREANLSDAVNRLLLRYREAVDRQGAHTSDESRAVADYLYGLAPRIKQFEILRRGLADTTDEAMLWRQRAEALEQEKGHLEETTADRIAALESDLAARRTEAAALEDELGRAYGTMTWRLRERVLASRGGRFLWRMLDRLR